MKTTKDKSLPTPALRDGRICFGIAYFTSEKDADTYATAVRERGDCYNGGMFHGMPCGRDKAFDFTHKTLGKLYAVTEQ